jgi:cell division protein ZapD
VANITAWLLPLIPLLEGIDLALRLLREGTEAMELIAKKGQYEFPLEGRNVLLVRIEVETTKELVAEISANKHLIAVRFRKLDEKLKLQAIEENIDFKLSLCNF